MYVCIEFSLINSVYMLICMYVYDLIAKFMCFLDKRWLHGKGEGEVLLCNKYVSTFC